MSSEKFPVPKPNKTLEKTDEEILRAVTEAVYQDQFVTGMPVVTYVPTELGPEANRHPVHSPGVPDVQPPIWKGPLNSGEVVHGKPKETLK